VHNLTKLEQMTSVKGTFLRCQVLYCNRCLSNCILMALMREENENTCYTYTAQLQLLVWIITARPILNKGDLTDDATMVRNLSQTGAFDAQASENRVEFLLHWTCACTTATQQKMTLIR
jgi:hypothetical protein